MEINYSHERPQRSGGKQKGTGIAATLVKALEETLINGGSVLIDIPESWMSEDRTPHAYAHGNLHRHIKRLWPTMRLHTRVDGKQMYLWLERKEEVQKG